MKKLKFWTPIFGGFFVIPSQKNYLDGDFFKHPSIMYSIFMLWHISWVLLPFILVYYGKI